jgi:CRISPR-associated protein Cas1
MFTVELKRHLIKLRLTRTARFHFNHGGALMGLLCRALGTHDLPAGVMPFACESGRVQFASGDLYHIGLTVAGTACEAFDVEQLRTELQQIGAKTPDPKQPLPTLSGNFEVIEIEDLPPPNPEEELSRLKATPSLTLRFLSPLRVERPPALKEKGAGFLNIDCFPLEHFTERLLKRLFLLTHGRYPDAQECRQLLSSLRPQDGAAITERHLMWLDIPLEGAPGKHENQPKGYTLGGVVGKIAFTQVPEAWLPFLVLGQYVHAGEKTHYGLGRYLIEECRALDDERFRPARTIYQDLINPARLEDAFEHIVEHSVAPGVDNCAPGDCRDTYDLLAARLATELHNEIYSPSPLLGFIAPKGESHLRPLAVPTVRDRMVQRAACELLSPGIETLLEDCAYAYRKGFSRAGAARAIEKAYDEGFRYVLDADITSFFDAVDWKHISAKLEALFPFEPLVKLIEEWIRVPIVFEGKLINRERGLPQGIPVSPLLANLYLDEFDEELLGRDYRLVRFADDFVVLCKNMESAQGAREDARRALERLGLRLNEEKTAVRSFDEGFTYLGYLFCRSLVMHSRKSDDEVLGELAPDAIPAASWLSQIPFERVRALVRSRNGAGSVRQVSVVAMESSVKVAPLTSLASGTSGGDSTSRPRPLYLTTFETTVRREGESLIVCAPEGEPVTIPIRTLSHVVCYGKVRISVPVLLALSEQGVPAYFCRLTGELKGIFGAPPADWPLWMAQARTAEHENKCVEFAREVVAAKLHNYAALAVRFRLEGAGQVAEELRELERECVNKTTIEALNGLEGRGAASYFGAMRETLASEWNFMGRRTQPPPDPVNAMLSFGYTLLYHRLSTALLISGLNPRIGLFHAEHGAYHALACDLQEEFRHLVDAQVWAMINRREVKTTDFYASEDGRYPCLMKQDFRRKFINAFEKRLASEFATTDGGAATYREFMEAQAKQVKEFVSGRSARYSPLRTREV